MMKIEAIIRPDKLDDVRLAIQDVGHRGLTITGAKGYGRQLGHTEIYGATEYRNNYLPKLKVEVVVEDDMVEKTIDAILDAAKTGRIGDGKVFVSAVDEHDSS